MGAVVFAGPESYPVPVREVEAVAAPEDAAEVVEAPKVEPKPKAGGKRRARHPAGAEEAKPGTYVGDDPATPDVDEAYEAG